MTIPVRTFDADAISAILLHESMGGVCAHDDVARIVADERNYAYLGALGATVFVRCEHPPDTYAILVGVRPEGRGAWGVAFFQECLDAMFAAGAQKIIGMIPNDRPASIGLGIAARRGARIERHSAFAVCTFKAAPDMARPSGLRLNP